MGVQQVQQNLERKQISNGFKGKLERHLSENIHWSQLKITSEERWKLL